MLSSGVGTHCVYLPSSSCAPHPRPQPPNPHTGTGAKIGGFAGDALPVARVMASVADTLITHPNVVNGAMLYWPMVPILKCQLHGALWHSQMLVP